MHVTLAKALVLAAGVGAMPSVGSQPASNLVVHAVRAYRPSQGRTEVNAFMQIPYMLLEPTTDGPGGALSYKIQVRVADSTGLTLLQNSWQNHAPAAARAPNASAVDMVRFSIAPGRYRLDGDGAGLGIGAPGGSGHRPRGIRRRAPGVGSAPVAEHPARYANGLGAPARRAPLG